MAGIGAAFAALERSLGCCDSLLTFLVEWHRHSFVVAKRDFLIECRIVDLDCMVGYISLAYSQSKSTICRERFFGTNRDNEWRMQFSGTKYRDAHGVRLHRKVS